MNIFFSASPQTVSLVLSPQELALAWIEKEHNHYVVKAYARIPLEDCVVVESRIGNPILLYDHIAHFLQVHGVRNPLFYCAMSGPGIVESVVQSPSSTHCLAEFSSAALNVKVWNTLYLYATDAAHFMWYCAQMDYSLLFQYALFAHCKGLNMVVFSTPFLAHNAAYKQIHKEQGRQNQLTLDLQTTDHDVSKLFTVSTLRKIVRVEPGAGVELERDFLILHTLVGVLFV